MILNKKMWNIIFLITAVVHQASCIMDWWDSERLAHLNRKRLIQIESHLMTDLERLVHTLMDIRFMYEESPHYEIGYVYVEVMERYRKMVDHVHYVHTYANSMLHTVHYLEKQQFLYLDCYHMIGMLHEISRKYASNDEFKILLQATETGNATILELPFEEQKARNEALAKEKRRRERAKKSRAKKIQRAQAINDLINSVGGAYGEGAQSGGSGINASPEDLMKLKAPRRPNTKPPSVTMPGRWFEYGWELNYEWW